MNLKAMFRSRVGFFERAGIDYALVGAFALKAYGYSRATEDVDFLVRSAYQLMLSKSIIRTFPRTHRE